MKTFCITEQQLWEYSFFLDLLSVLSQHGVTMLLDNRCLEQISNRKHTLHLQAATMHCNILRYENYNVLVYAGFIDPLAISAAEVNERRLASNCTCAIDTVAIALLWQIISPDVYDKVLRKWYPIRITR